MLAFPVVLQNFLDLSGKVKTVYEAAIARSRGGAEQLQQLSDI